MVFVTCGRLCSGAWKSLLFHALGYYFEPKSVFWLPWRPHSNDNWNLDDNAKPIFDKAGTLTFNIERQSNTNNIKQEDDVHSTALTLRLENDYCEKKVMFLGVNTFPWAVVLFKTTIATTTKRFRKRIFPWWGIFFRQ